MSRPGRAALVVCVVAVALAAVPGALGAGEYGLDSPSAVDVPDRTMAIGYEGFAVDSIARVSNGESLVIRATAPPDTPYRVELVSSLRMGVAISDREMRGTDTASFETEHLEPGSYLAALFEGDEIRAVLPVVVEGYAVSVDGPGTVEAGTEATVTATLSKDPASPELDRVELLVVDGASGETVVQQEMTSDGSGYSATIRPSEPGEYDVYVNVRGQKAVRDERVLLGFSDRRTLSVTAPSSPTDGETETASTDANDGEATPSETAPATTAPEGVITRTATVDSSAGESPPTAVLSTALTLFLAAGLGLLLRTRR